MMHHGDEGAGQEKAVSALEQDKKCPMTCCMQVSSRTARPAPPLVIYTPSLVSETFVPFESQVFTATGFSSHTDRGPPTLL